jgi:hypothetical protein
MGLSPALNECDVFYPFLESAEADEKYFRMIAVLLYVFSLQSVSRQYLFYDKQSPAKKQL